MTAVLGLVLAAGPLAAPGPDAWALVAGMAAAYARVVDYTAVFTRREVVDGALRPPEEIVLKFRRPRSFYLRWRRGGAVGRQILFVEGRHGGRMLLHEPGFLSGLVTVVMAPDSPLVLRESRHPVTEIGLGRLIDQVLANAVRARGRGELTVVAHGPDGEGGRAAQRVEIVLPRAPQAGYYCQRVMLWIDAATGFPLRSTVYDWNGVAVEDYRYGDLVVNPGLADGEFEPTHDGYAFSRWRIER